MEVGMANKAKSKPRQGQTRDQRRVRAQQWIFIGISILIVLTMIVMAVSKL